MSLSALPYLVLKNNMFSLPLLPTLDVLSLLLPSPLIFVGNTRGFFDGGECV